MIVYLKEIYTFIQQGCMKLIQIDSKDIAIKIHKKNHVLLNFLFIRDDEKTAQLFSTFNW